MPASECAANPSGVDTPVNAGRLPGIYFALGPVAKVAITLPSRRSPDTGPNSRESSLSSRLSPSTKYCPSNSRIGGRFRRLFLPSKCDQMSVLVLDCGPYRMPCRNPPKIGRVQIPHRNGSTVDDYPVLPDLNGLPGQPHDSFEESKPQPRIVGNMQQNEVSALWQTVRNSVTLEYGSFN